MDYSVTMFLRQIWHDPRLTYKDYNKSLALNYMRPQMWVPDLYFINEKQSKMHELTTPNLLMRLHPDGMIVYSQKVTVQLWCIMDLRKFPLDTQKCEMKMESYGYTTEEVKLQWVNGTGNALQFAHKQLSEYELLSEHIGHCTEVYYTGSYSCLNVTFKMERKFGYYVIQTYIPTVLIVILSWVSFWIDVHAVPARISVGLLTVLSMTTQSSGMRAQLPRVSYVKAIDVWQSASLMFVFGALIEFAIANFSQRLRDRYDNVKVQYDGEGTRRCSSSAGSVLRMLKPRKAPPLRKFKNRLSPNFYRKPSFLFTLHQNPQSVSAVSSVSTCADCTAVESDANFVWRRRSNGFVDVQSPLPHTVCGDLCKCRLANGVKLDCVPAANGSAKPYCNDQDNVSHSANSTNGDCVQECKKNSRPSRSIVRTLDPEKIDQLARYLFPASFVLFNLFYWLYYLYVK